MINISHQVKQKRSLSHLTFHKKQKQELPTKIINSPLLFQQNSNALPTIQATKQLKSNTRLSIMSSINQQQAIKRFQNYKDEQSNRLQEIKNKTKQINLSLLKEHNNNYLYKRTKSKSVAAKLGFKQSDSYNIQQVTLFDLQKSSGSQKYKQLRETFLSKNYPEIIDNEDSIKQNEQPKLILQSDFQQIENKIFTNQFLHQQDDDDNNDHENIELQIPMFREINFKKKFKQLHQSSQKTDSQQQNKIPLEAQIDKINSENDQLNELQQYRNLQKETTHPQTHIKTKYFFNQIKKSLLFLRKLEISPQELMDHQVFSCKPFEKPWSEEFIYYTKTNQLEKLQKLYNLNKYLIFDFDYYNMSALHWACKQGHLNIVEHLIDWKCDLDSEDVIGRRPLDIAVQQKHYEIVKILLENKAIPWSGKNFVNMKVLIQKDRKLELLISRARRWHIIQKLTPIHLREKAWKECITQ